MLKDSPRRCGWPYITHYTVASTSLYVGTERYDAALTSIAWYIYTSIVHRMVSVHTFQENSYIYSTMRYLRAFSVVRTSPSRPGA